MDGAPRIDAGDESGGDPPPGVGEGEADPKEGEPGIVAPHFLRVTHLRQGESVGVEIFEIDIVIRGAACDVVQGGLFLVHLCDDGFVQGWEVATRRWGDVVSSQHEARAGYMCFGQGFLTDSCSEDPTSALSKHISSYVQQY